MPQSYKIKLYKIIFIAMIEIHHDCHKPKLASPIKNIKKNDIIATVETL